MTVFGVNFQGFKTGKQGRSWCDLYVTTLGTFKFAGTEFNLVTRVILICPVPKEGKSPLGMKLDRTDSSKFLPFCVKSELI